MLSETLSALAAAGGTGIVQAAGTDVWTAIRERIARLLGRGRTEDERLVQARLDRTSQELEAAAPQERAALAQRQEHTWQTRLADFLEGLEPAEQAQAAEQLRALLVPAPAGPAAQVHADNSGVTAGRDIDNQGGAIGRDFSGSVTIGAPDRPTPPGTDPR
ncbi:hypothetical protein ACFVHI_34065 [Kitasatospora sp. NPDC127121]|uniref:hypothetical protein n=1 Tax=Kitasatospora sp. NPDC127121 TaxID=3345371 RepID=UPI0036450EB7